MELSVFNIKGEDALIGIVDSTYEPPKASIVKIKELTEDMVNMSCTLIVGNDLYDDKEMSLNSKSEIFNLLK